MKRRSFLGTSAALVAGSMLSRPDLHAEAGSAHHLHAASLMTECANRFLASLEPNQRGRATFAFEADERTNWHYIPANTKIAADQLGERKGIPLFDMSPYQKHLASALLAAGLSQTGLIKALTIMSLEEVLQVMEGDNGSHRNPEKYYVSVFGTPSDTQAWGYRVEGHHLSQNFTVVNGTAVNGPSFFGANPAEVRQGPRKGLRALGREDDLGSEVIRALDEQQQKVAIVSAAAYDEILTGASRKAALQGQPSGLSAAKMNARQFDGLMTLIGEYAHNVPGELAAGRIDQINHAGRNIYFAWSGGIRPGDAHYYRIQAPSFLIEFDDTQNNANHIHTVWRNFTGDFGEDLLGSHYRAGHEQSR